MAGVQRQVSGPPRDVVGKIQAGVVAKIGDLCSQDAGSEYFEPFSVASLGTAAFALIFVGVLRSGAQDGSQTADQPCSCASDGEFLFDLNAAAAQVYPVHTLVGATGNTTVAPLLAAAATEAIGKLAKPVAIGDTKAVVRIFALGTKRP